MLLKTIFLFSFLINVVSGISFLLKMKPFRGNNHKTWQKSILFILSFVLACEKQGGVCNLHIFWIVVIMLKIPFLCSYNSRNLKMTNREKRCLKRVNQAFQEKI